MDQRAREIEAVYRERFVGFRNALAAVTGSRESAHDAVQEAFARALHARDAYRGDAPMAAWIWTIAYRIALGLGQAPTHLPIELTTPARGIARIDDGPDPELADALDALSPRRRLVVFLRYYADFTYAEIGAVLGIAEGTVAATLAHAHRDLRVSLTAEEIDARTSPTGGPA